jgi:hypothetical protein
MVVRSLGVTLLFFSAACSPSPANPAPDSGAPAGDGSCPDPADKSDANLASPTVSFAHDIVPIFRASCAFQGSTCHGNPDVAVQGRPFLAYQDGGTDASQIRGTLVGALSAEDPKMNLVTPGNLDQSFLWQKLDNLQCKFASDCRAGMSAYPDCGQLMPFGNPALEESTLDTIARWITQGAQNN